MNFAISKESQQQTPQTTAALKVAKEYYKKCPASWRALSVLGLALAAFPQAKPKAREVLLRCLAQGECRYVRVSLFLRSLCHVLHSQSVRHRGYCTAHARHRVCCAGEREAQSVLYSQSGITNHERALPAH